MTAHLTWLYETIIAILSSSECFSKKGPKNLTDYLYARVVQHLQIITLIVLQNI